jgi:hypothetical protein
MAPGVSSLLPLLDSHMIFSSTRLTRFSLGLCARLNEEKSQSLLLLLALTLSKLHLALHHERCL